MRFMSSKQRTVHGFGHCNRNLGIFLAHLMFVGLYNHTVPVDQDRRESMLLQSFGVCGFAVEERREEFLGKTWDVAIKYLTLKNLCHLTQQWVKTVL